jgi:serine/threonine-protein kinase
MADLSQGNFMYLSHVLPALDRGDYRNTSLERLPRGLEDYYASHWRRMRDADPATWDHRLRVLAALVAREAPVRAERLQPYTGLDDRRLVGQALRQFRQFLRVEERPAERPGDRPVKLYSIYHKAFRDFLRQREEIGELDLGAASRRIAEHWIETHLDPL